MSIFIKLSENTFYNTIKYVQKNLLLLSPWNLKDFHRRSNKKSL